MKKLGLFMFLFVLLTNSSFAFFTDIPENPKHPYYTSIKWMYDNGVVEGYSDGTFKSDQLVNRAEFLKMLYGTLNVKVEDVEEVDPFTDVPKNEWFTDYVRKAYMDNVVDGYADRTFRPEQTINFAEAVKIISEGFFDEIETAKYEVCLIDFKRDYPNEWFTKYLVFADDHCIIPGYVNGISGFSPNFEVTRGDMVEMLYRAKAVKDNEYPGWDRHYQSDFESGALVPTPLQTKVDANQRVAIMGIGDGYWEKLVLKDLTLAGTVMDYGNYSKDCEEGLGTYCNAPTLRFVVDPSDRWKIYGALENFHLNNDDYDALKPHFGKAFTIKLDEIINFSEGYAAYEYELSLED